MAVVGDKYTLTVTAYRDSDTVFANPLVNVFAYEATSGTPSAADLSLAFQSSVIPDWIAAINIHTVLKQIEIINLDDPADFNLDAINEAGDQSGDPLPSFVAFEFEYIRALRGAHNGRKALAGVDENMLTNGAATSGELTLLNIVAADLGSLIAGTGGAYTPKIWRRAGNYAPYSGTPPVGTPYPDTFYPIQGVRYNRVSTQNSRKK